MKKINPHAWVFVLVAVALFTTLSSFSHLTGAHSVQVYFDGKLMLEQYINTESQAPRLMLNPAEKYSQLIVKYNECGRTVTGRTLTLKDGNDKVLKDWHFDGASTGYRESMTCSVKEVLALKPKGSETLKLFYSSKDFPQGQQIAYLVISDVNTASN